LTRHDALVLLLLVLTASCSASADAFYFLVGYNCDNKANQFHITYDGAYNSAKLR
jgi:hypothetical protein